ncbi:MAG TPA: hypothetical protein VH092_23700 [Urbifossiella sp.]|jgi:hypothetical protein|nr:hypothetical protein [Urbifossiella sp.]
MGIDRKTWPLLVQLGLWGVPNRTVALVFFWLSTVTVAACILGGLIWWEFFLLGAFGILAPLWYLFSIRWVDANGGWEESPRDDDEW